MFARDLQKHYTHSLSWAASLSFFNLEDEFGLGECSSFSDLSRLSGNGLIRRALFHPLERLEGDTSTDGLVAVVWVAHPGGKTFALGVKERKRSNNSVGFVLDGGALIFVSERREESVD
jgi:hypothetical protein